VIAHRTHQCGAIGYAVATLGTEPLRLAATLGSDHLAGGEGRG